MKQKGELNVSKVLFENVLVFDWKNWKLSRPSNVLVSDWLIEKITLYSSASKRQTWVKVIKWDWKKVLMPGMIDAHWHTIMMGQNEVELMASEIWYVYYKAWLDAKRTLMHGFTTVRDMWWPSFWLKKAIDEEIIEWPRIYPSWAMISQTWGHWDFRLPNDVPKILDWRLSYPEIAWMVMIVDNPDEIRLRVREQLRKWASQIKMMAWGGVSSKYDPIDVTQYTVEELKAWVDAAKNWGTYVAVHAYTPRSIQNALEAWVMSIEHWQMIDEPTAKMIAKNWAWLSLQPFKAEGSDYSPEAKAKKALVASWTDKAYSLAKKHKIKVAFWTDVLFDNVDKGKRQNLLLTYLTKWYKPAEILIMATSNNAELLNMSGKRNPYPWKLWVIEKWAYADMLLINGNPLEDINILADPDENILVIMKAGKVFKNIVK